MKRRNVTVGLLGMVGFVACTGASESDLYDPVPVPNEAGASSSGALDAGGSSSGSIDDAGGSSGASSSSGDAAVDDDGGDAAPADPDVAGVFCSEAVGHCSGATPVCCAVRPASGALSQYACVAVGDCPAARTSITCDDNDDCAGGTVCCNENSADGTPQAISCKADCAPGASVSILCDAAKPDVCQAYNPGSACQQQPNLAPGMFICQ